MKIENYVVAQSLDEAHELLNADSLNTIIGGGAWLKQANKDIKTIIDLKDLGLDKIIINNDCIEIGSMVSLYQLETDSTIMNIASGLLCKTMRHIMGVAFRNIATIGGSIMGRFAFSDLLTPLLALGADLEFYPNQVISLEEFLLKPKKTNDILVKVLIKKNKQNGYFKKVSNTHLDFAQLNIAIVYTNGKFNIALGARPSIATYAYSAMSYLNNHDNLTDEVIEKAAQLVIDEIKFGSNAKASKEYREQLAYTYVKRGIKEVIQP